ncbi:DUF2336 domain-containing protein [uncultured Enterovirga sp.]|uniref:DUF2336 domain-containing protein n=1 Tax=uncultured Enterovirga sp. TaxID=2026352 RepID=UPI0035CBCFC7
MLSISSLISDVEGNLGRSSGEDRARTLRRITDLFVNGSSAFGPEQVDLFDTVIQRFATAIETRARVELAERLASLSNAPPRLILQLASDEIVVARPVLAGSPRLDDQTLLTIALGKGRDHMLAICERPRVSPVVTDVLVTEGDGVVRHAIVSNPGACFSPTGTATLIGHAKQDEALGALLGERPDLSPLERKQVMDLAKDFARHRLLEALPGAEREIEAAVERGASSFGSEPGRAPRNYAAAARGVDALLRGRPITEEDIAGLAEEGRIDETISAVASLAGLSIGCVERIIEEPDNDLLLVIGKARGWSWRTVRTLLRLRDPNLSERHHFRRAEETFDTLASATASRVVHFLKVRETSGHGARHARSERIRYG